MANTYKDTLHSELEPRTKRLLSKLYQAESRMVQKRNALIEQLEEVDTQIEDIVEQRNRLSSELKKLNGSATKENVAKFEEFVDEVEEKQRWWASKAAEAAIVSASHTVSTFADRAADAGRSTWDRIRSSFNFSRDTWEDMRTAYQNEANKIMSDIDNRLKVIEGKIGNASDAMKAKFEEQKKDLIARRQALGDELNKVADTTKETWHEVEKRISSTIDSAKQTLRNQKDQTPEDQNL